MSIYFFDDAIIDPTVYPWGYGFFVPPYLIESLLYGGTITTTRSPSTGSIENILDNDESTSAYYSTDAETSITRDFGQKVYIKKIRARFGTGSDSSRTHRIEVSSDNSNWTVIATGDWRHELSEWFNVEAEYRYVRLAKTGDNWHEYFILNVMGRV